MKSIEAIEVIRRSKLKLLQGAVFCLSLFFAGSSLSSAATREQEKGLPIQVGAAVDKSSIKIGDKITYTITVKAKKNIEVEFPKILTQHLAGFTIKDFGSSAKGLFAKKTFKQDRKSVV